MGTRAKITASTAVFARSDRSRQTKPTLLVRDPAVTETGIVLDLGKFGIDLPERLADALHQAAHIGAITLLAVAGNEILAVHEVVDLAVPDIFASPAGEQGDDAELRQAQIDHRA